MLPGVMTKPVVFLSRRFRMLPAGPDLSTRYDHFPRWFRSIQRGIGGRSAEGFECRPTRTIPKRFPKRSRTARTAGRNGRAQLDPLPCLAGIV